MNDILPEYASSPNLAEMEFSRRRTKIRLVAATLPSLEGMVARLLDPAVVRTKAPKKIIFCSFKSISRRLLRMLKHSSLSSTKCAPS